MKLYPFQEVAITKVAALLKKFGRTVLCSPTGSGKTVMASEIVRRHLEKKLTNRVCILTHREALLSQMSDSIQNYAGRRVEELKAGQKICQRHLSAGVVVCMVETLKRRDFTHLGTFTLLIIDEAHRKEFTKVVEDMDITTLAMTATPIFASRKVRMKDVYRSIHVTEQIPMLIKRGFLAAPIPKKVELDFQNLKQRAGEFTDESQLKNFTTQVTNFEHIFAEFVGNKAKTIIFCVNRAHTRHVAKLIGGKVLLSDMPKAEKDSILANFRSSETGTLVNCDIATTGFNIPDTTHIIVFRSTRSLTLWLQMIGRGGRIIPGKNTFHYLDMGGNIDRLGRWEAVRDWEAIFNEPLKDKGLKLGISPIKECKKCGAYIPASATICGICGAEQKSSEKEESLATGKIIDIASDLIFEKHPSEMSASELVNMEKAGALSIKNVWRILRKQEDLTKLYDYAHIKKYNPRWVQNQLRWK